MTIHLPRFPVLSYGMVQPSSETDWQGEIPAAVKRRDPRIWQLAYMAAKRTLSQDLPSPRAIIIATALGALDETRKFLDGVFTDGLGSPRSFIASVHNSMGGRLGILFKIGGPNLTFCDGQNSLASAISGCALLSNDDFPALIIAVDENIALLESLHPHLGKQCRRYMRQGWPDGAAAFLLDAPGSEKHPAVIALGPRPMPAQSVAAAFCAQLCKEAGDDVSALLPLDITSASFMAPAFNLVSLLSKSAATGASAIGSYSPAAHAAAVVRVCR